MSSEVLIALFGLTATVVVAVVSQWAQARREAKRLATDVEERKSDRIFEHRTGAYADFTSLFKAFWNEFFDSIENGIGRPPDTDDLQPMHDSLAYLRLFGTEKGHKSANRALSAMYTWALEGNPDDPERLTSDHVWKTFEVFLDQARVDLGSGEWQKPTSQ